MLSQTHAAALAQTEQYDLGMDLLSRLQRVTSYSERLDILEQAEEQFGQLEVRAHALRVADAARALSLHCGFDETYANRLYNATRLHDIGKLFMPTQILEKDGRPTDDEYALIREHARHGGDLLGPSAPEFVRNVARFHHERYDGKGYNNLVGENIPIEARLVQVADVYDALRSKRSYKPGLSEEGTLESMIRMQGYGVMFDPYLLRRFVEMRLAADHDRQISPEKAEEFAAFAKSRPMDDLAKAADPAVFQGWQISADGQRRRKVFDETIKYDVLVEKRDALGEVKFRLEDRKPSSDMAREADNSNIPAPRGPRF
ncbi:HD domain-containing protein [Pararhizobium sp. BT-229]|uniref:HD-GYP domain-containing protein n=1 Tax=Pararhizobium sp. BT-229 TaxID=2986923 RepID=UPI0021F6F152|nr:HD domain-containing phosphohydrolase [Pararhizobium sp. BT-229]MCV9965099.1 HD domain-containing protein [Pararhizobium sp. BT-229]